MQTRVIPTSFFIILALLAFYAMIPLLQVAPDLSHAVFRHGASAIKAADCIEDPNNYMFYNDEMKRFGYACEINGRWAVAFTNLSGRRITAFFKEKLKRLDQIIRYMENTGYVQ